MSSDILYWIWLSERLGTADPSFKSLVQAGLSPARLYAASAEELSSDVGLDEKTARKLGDKSLEDACRILSYCEERGVNVLTHGSAGYPELLFDIPDPPVVLYCLGNMPDLDKKTGIAVVGTRQISEYGMKNAYTLSFDMAFSGAVIVSGMARGNDAVAACGAMEAGGTTVAVLGSGIDIVYPAEHRRLFEAITRHGAVVTEYAPGCGARSWHFPTRNRIISGLSRGTLVIEAAQKSGSLLTAEHARVQGRKVFAVPANLDLPNAVGTNELLRNGATVVLTADDVLSAFPTARGVSVNVAHLSGLRDARVLRPEYLEKYGVNIKIAASDEKEKKNEKTSETPVFQPKKHKKASDPSPQAQRVEAASAVTDHPVPEDLTEIQKRILSAFPVDGPVSLDGINVPDVSVGELIAALTILEIRGLVQALPGGLYLRA